VEPTELLRKAAISGTTLPQIILNRQQTERFLDDVRDMTALLKHVRNVRRDHPSGELNRLYFSGPVTEDASLTAQTKSPSESVVNYDSTKLRSAFDLKTDFIEDIKAQSPEDARKAIAKMFATQIANDIEQLAIRGDSSLSGTSDADDRLERTNDGYIKILDDELDSSQVIDAAGAGPSKELYRDMIKAMPNKYKRNKAGLRWIASPGVVEDWIYDVSTRATPAGDRALEGIIVRPFGVPFIETPLMPEDLTYGTATTDCTRIILCDPKNFLYIVQRKVTWEWDRDPRNDEYEVTIHTRVDFVIEIPGACVMAKNVSLSGSDYS